MPSTRTTLALLAVVVLAGCGGGTGTGGTPAPSTTTAPPTTSAPPPAVAFEDLSAPEQRLVRTAIEDGPVTANFTVFETLSPNENATLRYEGARYRLRWDSQSYEARYAIGELTGVNASTVEDEDEVVDYANLSDRGQAIVDEARATGSSADHSSEDFPDPLRSHSYVRIDGSVYRLQVIVGDLPVWELHAEPAG